MAEIEGHTAAHTANQDLPVADRRNRSVRLELEGAETVAAANYPLFLCLGAHSVLMDRG